MELIDALKIINKYQEFIKLLEEERETVQLLIKKLAPEATTETPGGLAVKLQLIEYKKRLWNLYGEIEAKRQYIEQYRKRAAK